MAATEAHNNQDLSNAFTTLMEDTSRHPYVSKILDLMNDDKIFQAYREEQVCFFAASSTSS
jgi:hypothetical protein